MKEKMALVNAIIFFGGSIILLLLVPELPWYGRILAASSAFAAGMGFMYWRSANSR